MKNSQKRSGFSLFWIYFLSLYYLLQSLYFAVTTIELVYQIDNLNQSLAIFMIFTTMLSLAYGITALGLFMMKDLGFIGLAVLLIINNVSSLFFSLQEKDWKNALFQIIIIFFGLMFVQMIWTDGENRRIGD